MENTSPLMFDNVDEKYFLAIKGRAVGPLTGQEVYEKMQSAEVGLLHFLWREGWTDWKRLCDDREFAVLVPQKPSSASIAHIRSRMASKKAGKAPPPPVEEQKNFYLYFNSSQYGPFSKSELVHVLKSHKLGRAPYLWMPGWANWKRLSELPEFAEYLEPAPDAGSADGDALEIEQPSQTGKTRARKSKQPQERRSRTRGSDVSEPVERTLTSIETRLEERVKVRSRAGIDASDKRGGPRRPLVARLFLHNDKDVIIAVCRDISVGGMQVLTDRVPGPVGSRIKLNVSPGDPSKVKGFVAEGEIVRILEDGRGFSFRFRKISPETKKMIESYISD